MTTNSQFGTLTGSELACEKGDGTLYTSAWSSPTENLCGENFPWIAFDYSTSDEATTNALSDYYGAFAGNQTPFTPGDNLINDAIEDSYYTNYVDIGIVEINDNSADDWFEIECLVFDPAADYEQWDIAC